MCRSLFHPTISQSQWYVARNSDRLTLIQSVWCVCKAHFQSTDLEHSSVVENSSEQLVTNLETTNSFCANSASRASNLWECVEKNSQPFWSWLLWLLGGLEVKQGILTLLPLRRRLNFRWKINTETPPYFKIYLQLGKEKGDIGLSSTNMPKLVDDFKPQSFNFSATIALASVAQVGLQ